MRSSTKRSSNNNNYALANENDLRSHVTLRHVGWLPFECIHCESLFPTKIEVLSHLDTEHKTLKQRFVSEEDDVKFKVSRKWLKKTTTSRGVGSLGIGRLESCEWFWGPIWVSIGLNLETFLREGGGPIGQASGSMCGLGIICNLLSMTLFLRNQRFHWLCSEFKNKNPKILPLQKYVNWILRFTACTTLRKKTLLRIDYLIRSKHPYEKWTCIIV